MDMKLYLVPSCDDRADDLGNDLRTIDERGHRVDEEYAGQPVAFEHVHLEMDAEIAIATTAEDRAVQIGAHVDALPVQTGPQFGVETARSDKRRLGNGRVSTCTSRRS